MMAHSKASSHSELLMLGRECAQLFMKAAENANIDRIALENNMSKFKLWAGNIGLFASGLGGADWRFRDDENSRDLLKSMLEKLKQQLKNIVAQSSAQEQPVPGQGHQANQPTADSGNRRKVGKALIVIGNYLAAHRFDVSEFKRGEVGKFPEIPKGVNSSSLLASNTTNDGAVSRHSESPDSASVESSVELDTQFDDVDYNSEEDSIAGQEINKVIDMLYRFLKSVKRSRLETERSKVISFKTRHVDAEEDREFETFVRWLINRRLPNLTAALKERLIEAALYRRWRILYNKRHSEKEKADMETWFASSNAKPVFGEDPGSRQIFLSPDLTRKAPSIVIKQCSLSEKEMLFAPISTTEASLVQKLAVRSLKSAVTSVVTQSAIGRRNELDMPHPPKRSLGKSEETICPYCCDILGEKIIGARNVNEQRWRRHVIHDCTPYICLYDNCDHPAKQYRSIEEWVEHMRWSHAVQYCCNAVGHEDFRFDMKSMFEQHLQQWHSQDYNPSEFSEIVDRAIVPVGNAFAPFENLVAENQTICLLCGCPTHERSDDSKPNFRSQSDKRHITQNHIAGHLEAIALFSLPPGENMNSQASCSSQDSQYKVPADRDFHSLPPVRPPELFESPEYLQSIPGFPPVEPDYLWSQEYQHIITERSIPMRAAVEFPTWEHNVDVKFFHEMYLLELDRNQKLQPFIRRYRSSLFRVPVRRDTDFIDRTDILHKIHQKCTLPRSRTALVGVRGVGKSQLAVEYAYQTNEKSPETWIFWVHASNAASFEQGYRDIADQVMIPNRKEPKANIFKLVNLWLQYEINGKWVLILDNLGDADFITKAALSTHVPQSGNGSILITTRSVAGALELVDDSDILYVEPMNEGQAVSLCQKKLKVHSEIEDLIALSAELEYSPLAIVEAAAYINERAPLFSIRQYIQMSRMANLASTCRNQGRWKEAEELDMQMVEMTRRNLGSEHPDTLISMSNLSLTFWNQGRWKEAEQLEMQILEIRKRTLGSMHPDTLNSMNNLALMYRNQGQQYMAQELGVQVMEISEKVFGSEHPLTLASMSNLASTYKDQGRWHEAEKLEIKVVETRKRQLGEEHPDTLTSISKLASTYKDEGQWHEAKKLEIKVVEARKRQLGEEHPDTLTSISNLASTYKGQGQWFMAIELEMQVMEISEKVFGSEHPFTLASMSNLASTYKNQGRWHEAEKLEIKMVETRKRQLGEEHPDTLTSISNLASTFWNQDRWREAEELGMQVMETRKRMQGEEHPDTLTSMNNLAFTLKAQGRVKEAITLMKDCIQRRKQTLGPYHPHTASSEVALNDWVAENLDLD